MIKQIHNNNTNILSLEERQIGYERMFDKKQARELIRTRFKELVDKVFEQTEGDHQVNLMCDILGIVALRSKKTSINALVEMLVERTGTEEQINSLAEKVIMTVSVLNDKELVEASIDEKDRIYVEGKFTLNDDDLELLEQYQYKIPMLVKPLPLNQKGNNRGNGYYLNGTDSLILNHKHEYDIDHKVLERVNNIPFTLNVSLMENLRTCWKNADLTNKETNKNFERFERGMFKVSAILISNGNKFYFTHKYDKRGRLYSCGYHINYQGTSYSKAQLELANKQLITDEVKFF